MYQYKYDSLIIHFSTGTGYIDQLLQDIQISWTHHKCNSILIFNAVEYNTCNNPAECPVIKASIKCHTNTGENNWLDLQVEILDHFDKSVHILDTMYKSKWDW